MKHLFKSDIFKQILGVLIILLLVKILWLIVQINYLPSSTVDHKEKRGGKSLYYRVKLSPNEGSVPVKPTKRPVKIAGSIKDIKLIAIYNSSDTTVVTIEYKKKTKILGRGDTVNGFTLEGGGSNYATFVKEGKTYRVDLIKSKRSAASRGSIVPAGRPYRGAAAQGSASPSASGDVIDAGDHKIVDRSLLDYYADNMDEIYKNIGITEVKKGNSIEGFRVTFVKRGSPFAKLGLRRGDIIKSINGEELTSYNAAFNSYKNIKNTANLTLGIVRGKKEMELEYEVN